MNDASKWRLNVARKIALNYSGNPKVMAILAGGSTARGCADRYSDIEIGVFWCEIPTEEDRKTAISRTGGTIWIFNPYRESPDEPTYEGGEDCFYLGGDVISGLKIDVHHKLARITSEVLTDVIDRFDAAIEKQEIISTIQSAIPLHGSPLITEWKKKVAFYPYELACAVVEEHLDFSPFFGSAMLIEREHMIIEFYSITHSYIQQILCILMGLNKIYHRGDYKWLDQVINEMSIAPANLTDRIRQLYISDPQSIWNELHRLIEEICALVETHMPQINTASARDWFRISRQPWDNPPEGL